MILEEVILENVQCYYGKKTFRFTNGLNIVLSENGEGKTKFIEAFEWLFNGEESKLESLVSAKKLHETNIGERFSVSVSITVNQHDEIKTLKRFFIVEKLTDSVRVSKSEMNGDIVNLNGERTEVNGNHLLESVFPSTIRKYSIFKGEESLNIFDDKETLVSLINIYSAAKSYEKYHKRGEFLKTKADDAVNTELGRDTRHKKELDKININLKEFRRQIVVQETLLQETLETENNLEKSIKEVESFIHNAEEINLINEEIKKLNIKKNNIFIKDDYTTFLFDEGWILKDYKLILDEFTVKIKTNYDTKIALEVEHNLEQGKNKAEALTLVNNALPLPLTTPSKAIMESMLADQICKVCNTEAKKGSKPYNFMMNRLEALIESSKPSTSETEVKLFPNNYLRKLDYLSEELNENFGKLSSVPSQIKEKLELNESLKNQIIQIDKEIEEKENQKIRIIGKSTVGEDTLSKNLKNYTGWQHDLKRINREVNSFVQKIEDINKDLTAENLKKDRIQQSGGTNTKKLTQIKDFFQDIAKIFTDTKVKMFNEFVADLEKKANEKFKLINKGAFTGVIKIYIRNIGLRPQAEIELLDVNDKAFMPNKSLETSMYISIIMAISDLTKETQDEHYPMLMDAPVSSFGEIKKRELLEMIYNVKNQQTIVLFKDYLDVDENNKLFIIRDFEKVKRESAQWAKLERPFNDEKLETLNTIIQII